MIIAPDTNVIVRLLVMDDEAQGGRAARLFRQHSIVILPSVLLETEWVLRSGYGIGAEDIAASFTALLGLENVVTPDPDTIARALSGYGQGLDFADALHLAAAARSGAERLASFDRKLAKRAHALPGSPEVMSL